MLEHIYKKNIRSWTVNNSKQSTLIARYEGIQCSKLIVPWDTIYCKWEGKFVSRRTINLLSTNIRSVSVVLYQTALRGRMVVWFTTRIRGCEVYLIHHYVIKCVNHSLQVGGFLRYSISAGVLDINCIKMNYILVKILLPPPRWQAGGNILSLANGRGICIFDLTLPLKCPHPILNSAKVL